MILKIDLSLVALCFLVMTVGYWMMRTRVKAWAVPVNTLLAIVSLVLATVWGCMLYGFSISAVITYGIPNGVICWLGATAGYDFIHEYVKRKEEWLSVWKSFVAIFKKKEAKA